jgi:phage-related protein
MIEIVTVVISLIEQLLPVLGTSAATTTLIETIIGALTKILPLLVEFAPTVYNSVKNIITEVKADPATTAAQWDVLDAIDKQLDAANDAAINAVDPDAPKPVV